MQQHTSTSKASRRGQGAAAAFAHVVPHSSGLPRVAVIVTATTQQQQVTPPPASVKKAQQYGEESRKYRRNVFSNADWIKHRSTDRYARHISSIVTVRHLVTEGPSA